MDACVFVSTDARTCFIPLLRSTCACVHAKLLQSCPTLCDSKDSSRPGSSGHRIRWARILEWVAISFSSSTCELPVTDSLEEKEFFFNPLQQGGTTRGSSFSSTHFIHFFSSFWVRKGSCAESLLKPGRHISARLAGHRPPPRAGLRSDAPRQAWQGQGQRQRPHPSFCWENTLKRKPPLQPSLFSHAGDPPATPGRSITRPHPQSRPCLLSEALPFEEVPQRNPEGWS